MSINFQFGTEFQLDPGTQCAEGQGVYFSEGTPCHPSTAEGTFNEGQTGIIVIESGPASFWWRSKGTKAKKFGKPRTWHSNGKSLACKVQDIQGQYIYCSWNFI